VCNISNTAVAAVVVVVVVVDVDAVVDVGEVGSGMGCMQKCQMKVSFFSKN
jgi:hypothetical protein